MDNPIQDLCGHLLFSTNGTVWATWRLQGQPYGRRSRVEKEQTRVLHQLLYRSLGGESLHLGLEVDTDPVEVAAAMLRGLQGPLEHHPQWAEEVEATLERLGSELPLSERTYWLAVPLRNNGAAHLTEPLRAAGTSLLNQIGAPRSVPVTSVLAERLAQAAEIQALIPGPFHARPATPAEQVWIYRHAQSRGLARDDIWLPSPPSTHQIGAVLSMADDGDGFGGLRNWQSPGRIGRPVLDEAAVSDVAAEGWRSGRRAQLRQLMPSQRRVLKISDLDEDDASYQALAVLAGTPLEGTVFPGAEWLGKAEDSGVPLDWAVRMRNNARAAVLARNQRAVRNLNEQYEQREGEVSTGSHELDAVAAALTEYQSRLANDQHEAELETITIFATGAATREQALQQGAALSNFYKSIHFPLERPLGEQADAWTAMLPGTPWPRKFRDLTQISLSEGFSAAVPLMSSALGDGQGSLWAVNETTAAPSPVHVDLFSTIHADFSAAMAISGELGSGKSYAIKSVVGAHVDRGARLVAIDRSQTAEYVSFARSLGECTVAAVVDNPDAGVQVDHSLDPLRVFPGAEGGRVTQTLLVPLLSIDPGSDLDVALTETTALDYRTRNSINSLQELTEHLLHDDCLALGAHELGRRLRALRTKDYARVLFDPTLPALDVAGSRGLVFPTYGLALPSRAELLHEHLFKRLSFDKHFGRAMYALLTAIARRVAFADPAELVLFVVDECHHVTASIEGEEELTIFVREGRKVGAALIVGSQDCANDFGSETLRGLIPYRLVMRLSDERLARAALDWIGLEGSPEHLQEITTDLSPRDPRHPEGLVAPERRGEGIFRDSYRRTGRIRILGPALAARRRAYSSTPIPSLRPTPTGPQQGRTQQARPEQNRPERDRPTPTRPGSPGPAAAPTSTDQPPAGRLAAASTSPTSTSVGLARREPRIKDLASTQAQVQTRAGNSIDVAASTEVDGPAAGRPIASKKSQQPEAGGSATSTLTDATPTGVNSTAAAPTLRPAPSPAPRRAGTTRASRPSLVRSAAATLADPQPGGALTVRPLGLPAPRRKSGRGGDVA